MKPTEQRTSEFGDQRVAAFDSTGQAAYSYVLNLNTERAYRDLRLKRADLRRQKQRISGTVLAETLLHYSERGQGYVNDLEALIRENRLDGVDDAYLRPMVVIHIVPADSLMEVIDEHNVTVNLVHLRIEHPTPFRTYTPCADGREQARFTGYAAGPMRT